MKKSTLVIIVLILLAGVFYKLVLTSGGNFIFNMDNGRDMVDVREMVVLHQLRLIGSTSGIEGFFFGPGWYYLLAVPFILSAGNPYGSILLMIALWAVGGFFLLKILSRYGNLVVFLGGLFWISSNYVNLATLYAFNPNPVLLLTPLFIYLLERYLKKNTLLSALGVWILGGLFFNFEMAFGMFMPVIIIFSFLISGKGQRLKEKNFLIGLGFFIGTLLPQIFFELRHNFFMTHSLLNYLRNTTASRSFSFLSRFDGIRKLYLSVLLGTMMNWEFLTRFVVVAFVLELIIFVRSRVFRKDNILVVVFIFLIIPPVVHALLPSNIMPWYLGGTMAAAIVFLCIVLGQLKSLKTGKILFYGLTVLLLIYAVRNLELEKYWPAQNVSRDPAVYINEIHAIDYVYQQAQGRNFKVYTYLPSVIDYPYQYLFWSYGQKKYGYLPKDYAYLPNKPEYIRNKERFNMGGNPTDSGLTFLIKQPDDTNQRHLWENNFSSLYLLKSEQVGPLVVETRRQIPDNSQ